MKTLFEKLRQVNEAYYHGTSVKRAERILSGGFTLDDSATSNDFRGIYLSHTRGGAAMFADSDFKVGGPQKGEILKVEIKPGKKLFQLSGEESLNLEDHPDIPGLRKKAKAEGFEGKYGVQRYLESKGYAGLEHEAGEEIVVFVPDYLEVIGVAP